MTVSGELLAEATALSLRASEPAVSRNVLFGTAGWTDPSLVKGGLFYPKGVRTARARLEHYARHFRLVEVDATYYSLLPPEIAERWVSCTPDAFTFDVKAYPVFTGHPIDVRRLPGDLRDVLAVDGEAPTRVYPDALDPGIRAEIEARFLSFLEPLLRANRLGAVLLQFPPWFEATRGNARRIEATVERLRGIRVGVEFRNKTWLREEARDRVLALLRTLGASYVGVDEPDVAAGGVPNVVAVTNPALAMLRFHGQNRSGWRSGASVAERFDYLYAERELSGWVGRVRQLSDEADEVHVVFNNCVRNYAVVNAKGLSVLVGQHERSEDREEQEKTGG